jgi:hypothetical protein
LECAVHHASRWNLDLAAAKESLGVAARSVDKAQGTRYSVTKVEAVRVGSRVIVESCDRC